MDESSNELWVPVVGYEGSYEVSDLGRVRGLDRVTWSTDGPRKTRGRVLRGTPVDGYIHYCLYSNGQGRRGRAHVLVLTAFVGPPLPGQVGRHLDDDGANNVPSNLAWGTQSDNQKDAVSNGTHSSVAKTHCPRGHRLAPPNLVARSDGRACLACDRAWGYCRRHPEVDLDAAADRYYRNLQAPLNCSV